METPMSLASGARLGPYEIQAAIGAGGMGEVYRARDTRLDRTVAIKVLPAHVASDPQFRERFEREAKVVSSLDHPHICALYDVGHHDGTDFLVMQYLEGETLAARLARGPLPPQLVLRHGGEMADALDRAHRHGIVHRDLKPGNVMLTKDGAKLLDFGLAKHSEVMAAAAGGAAGWSALATREQPLTGHGTILGTFRYMAPEQLEGREADARSDIFALGSVLYEMATGRKAFDGKSQASLIAAILDADPPAISSVQPVCPPALDHVVRRCLAKDPDERWQSAHDVAGELRWIAEAGSQPGRSVELPLPGRRRAWRRMGPAVLGAIVGATLTSASFLWLIPGRSGGAVGIHATIVLPSGAAFGNARARIAVSPDGRQIVFGAIGDDGVGRLHLRSIDRFEATPIRGTEAGDGPFFSTDGRWLGFFSGGSLKKVALAGGAAMTLAEAPDVRGASWGAGDTVFFTPRLDGGLWKVSAGGGAAQEVTSPDAKQREKTHRFPHVLPDGRAVLFTIGTHDITSFADARIAVVSIATGQRKTLVEGGSYPRYSATGHIVYSRGDVLMAVPFDPRRLEVTGPPVPLMEGVAASTEFGWAEFALGSEGTLAYVPGGDVASATRLVWVDRKGVATPLSEAARLFFLPQLSPDGQRAVLRIGGANDTGWLYDLRRNTLTRVTFGGNTLSITWMPDGKRLAYSMVSELGWVAADASSGEETLFRDEYQKSSVAVSPDGQTILYQTSRPDTGWDIWGLSVQDRKAAPILATRFNETLPRVSPDGRWLAYVSNETGRAEVYVRPFPGPGTKTQVSTKGGSAPVWARSGRELFFRSGEEMLVVDVQSGASFDAGTPRVLFRSSAGGYDVAPDGQRFLMVQGQPRPVPKQINLVLGWFEELTRRAPRGK
jgi:serine/threonine-protein kinase